MSERWPGGIINQTAPVPSGSYATSTASGVWTLDQQAYWKQQGNWPIPGNFPNYIEDVFSTWLYTGNGTTQTITNGIDLAGKGGLVWQKDRVDPTTFHVLCDTARGVSDVLSSNDTSGSFNNGGTDAVYAFNSNGFSTGTVNGNYINLSGEATASWTFRKQPKFFDVVTYTGNGSVQTIAHNLGSTPGCIIVKNISATSNWLVYHKGYSVYGGTGDITQNLNGTQGASFTAAFNNTMPTSTNFQVGIASGSLNTNTNGNTYVAYLFASNAGGFGLTGTDNVITCDYYTGNGSTTGPVINLGYEPQWLMIKSVSSGNWQIIDNMRGMPVGSADAALRANLSSAESSVDYVSPTATGFQLTSSNAQVNSSGTPYIYIAIRRPMKVPTDATTVFNTITRSGTGANATITGVGFSPDMVLMGVRTGNVNNVAHPVYDRLRGPNLLLSTTRTFQENFGVSLTDTLLSFDMNGISLGADSYPTDTNQSGLTQANYYFSRRPGFFDEVCYTGTGSATNFNHNLGVAPELVIIKTRSTTYNWVVYNQTVGAGAYLNLNNTNASISNGTAFNNTAPTSTVFTVGGLIQANESGQTYVAYLFATCTGVSKVGSYTGNGTTQAIACGFTGGARFVLIKRTDSTGDWYVYDTARGMTLLTDPYIRLNSNVAESATLGSVTTTAGGFTVDATILAAVNTNAASYIFLAIA
jgi:hypothetical protein